MNINKFHIVEIYPDYHQFYLIDNNVDPDFTGIWTPNALKNMIGLKNGLVGISTARISNIPITLTVRDFAPAIELDKYDKINECSLNVPSGKIVVMGCTDYIPEAKRIIVNPGVYRLYIKYGNLDKISEDALEGEDFYEIDMWLENEEKDMVVIK